MIFILLLIIIISLILTSVKIYHPTISILKKKEKFSIVNDDSVNGKINPFFCYGNPITATNKCSFATFNIAKNPYKVFNIFGVGDRNGAGWQGGDSVGSIELSNGDLLFVFGDSFFMDIIAPNAFLSFRNPKNVVMVHNSVSYMSLGNKKVANNTFFIGQNKDYLINDIDLSSSNCLVQKYNIENYKKNPIDFTPTGCETLLQPTNLPGSSKKISCWLYGGICKKNDIAILCGNYASDMSPIGFQFIEIKNAINSKSLQTNPFLWDKSTDTIRHDFAFQNNILWEKVNKIDDKNYIIYGGKNLNPGTEIYLLKGTYDEILSNNFKIWNGKKWKKKDLNSLHPIQVYDNKIIGANYFSEFDYDKKSKHYYFFGIGMSIDKKYILERYISKNLTGPYFLDKNFDYLFPEWINVRAHEINCYNLRSHPGLAKCFQVKSVLSYVCQGYFPQYSGLLFDDFLSSYNIYYPQFILIDF